MPLQQFYHVLGMILVVVPLAATLAILLLAIFRHLRWATPLPVRALLLLNLVALAPALAGIALMRLTLA
ncbi:hypothetical protein [Halotalea alkalilenta]|uniref:Uncharacterized protein n=1 Tax=Halotalea alkalilenta TaxID=376489 RepID=A0A172YEF5_9GAMM|nr:hypothetical protein [Halotalea alkalilenta]ANF57604.1 hypothetical protein A5892_09120 [Halotalea alkalilenta]